MFRNVPRCSMFLVLSTLCWHIEHFCCFTNFSSLKLNIMAPKINRIYQVLMSLNCGDRNRSDLSNYIMFDPFHRVLGQI